METVFRLADEVHYARPSNDASPLAVPPIIGSSKEPSLTSMNLAGEMQRRLSD
jgi:hypothetical protein